MAGGVVVPAKKAPLHDEAVGARALPGMVGVRLRVEHTLGTSTQQVSGYPMYVGTALHEMLADVVAMMLADDDDGAAEGAKVEEGMVDGSDKEGAAAVDDTNVTTELVLIISGVEDGTIVELASEADVVTRDSENDTLLGLQREAWTSWPAAKKSSAMAPRLGNE